MAETTSAEILGTNAMGTVARITLCQSGRRQHAGAPRHAGAFGPEHSRSGHRTPAVEGGSGDGPKARILLPRPGAVVADAAQADQRRGSFRERAWPRPILGVYAQDVRAHARARDDSRGARARRCGFGCAFAVASAIITIAANGRRASRLPEMDANLPPTLAISALLHKVPHKRLTHLVLTRESFGAEEALALDVVSKLAAPHALEAETAAYVARLTDRDRRALAAVKEYMLSAPYLDTHAAARLGANLLATVFSSPEEPV